MYPFYRNIWILRCKTLSLNHLHASFRYRNLLHKIELKILYVYKRVWRINLVFKKV
jgi:hypothetical protein